MLKDLVCPVSSEKVDSNISRMAVFMNAVLLIQFLLTLNPVFIYIVIVDCALRTSGIHRLSPFFQLASLIRLHSGMKEKMVDKAPKMFASRLGFICAALGAVFIGVSLPTASIIVIGMFASLAVLDSVFNFCVGCVIYHYLIFPYFRRD